MADHLASPLTWQRWRPMLLVALAYFALALVAMQFGVAEGNASVLWPSSGLALFALLRYGPGLWPGIFAGALAAGIWTGDALWVSLAIAATDTLDAVAGAWLLRRLRFDDALARLGDYYRLVAFGGILPTLISTLTGPSALCAAGVFSVQALPDVMLHWWMGDILGVVLVAPALLIWRDFRVRRLPSRRRLAEGILLGLLFGYFCGVLFLGWEPGLPLQPYIQAFWIMPFLVWTALRFGRHGMVLILMAMFAISLLGVLQGSGVFGSYYHHTGLVNFWFYHMIFCVTGMTMSLVLREREDAMLGLRQSAQVFEHSSHGIMITDADRRIVSVNRAFSDITGYAAAEVIGRTPRLLHSGTHDPAFYTAMWEAIEATGCWSGEIWNRRKDGSLYVEWLDIRAIKSPLSSRVESYIGLFMDITDRKLDEQHMLHQAHHDFLTGLPNRLLFTDRFAQAQAAAQRDHARFCLLYLDLDGFKQINDRYGHHVGDLLLKEMAQRLSRALRATDTVCRLGGDEFVILLPGVDDINHIEALAAKLLVMLGAPYRIEGHLIEGAASIGYALYPEDGAGLDALLAAADGAMYRAKQSGGNRVAAAADMLRRDSAT